MKPDANFAFFSADATVLEYARAAVGVGLWESEKKLLAENFPRDAKILELGAGAGRVSLALAKLGYAWLTVSDFAPAMVEIAREIFADAGVSDCAEFRVEDATELAFPNAVFDGAIFAFNGWQMIPRRARRERALAEIARVLKPGGIFFFTGHDRTHPLRKAHWEAERARWENGEKPAELDEFGDSFYATPHGNVFIHSAEPGEVRVALADAGFAVEFSELRSRVCAEPENVREFSDDTRLWLARKRS